MIKQEDIENIVAEEARKRIRSETTHYSNKGRAVTKIGDEPKALAWTEKTYYIECPECNHVETLGIDVFGVPKEWLCEECNKTFPVDDQT